MTAALVPGPRARRAVWGDGHSPGLAGAARDALGMVGTALRLLARHWPALLALYLAAVVARELVMRAAVPASSLNAELGWLVLLLAPMTALTALVLMLRVVRPSLPWLGSPAGGRPPSLLEHLGSVLVPFMTIYYFEDWLRDDIFDYSSRVFDDFFEQTAINLLDAVETETSFQAPQSVTDRLPYDLSVSLVAVVLAAIVARWLLSRWSASQRHRWLGLPGAYLELVWLTLVAVVAFQAVADLILDWGGNRRLVQVARTAWEAVVGTATGAAPASDQPTSWFLGQLGHVDAVLIIPLSWLAIGAVVFGHQREPAAGGGAGGAGDGPAARGHQLYQRASQRWLAAPRGLRWLGEKVTEDLRERFTPLVHGVRMLLRTGLAPILLFCLAFVAAKTLADWLWELQRLLIGPRDVADVWIALSWPLSAINDAVGQAVLVCLLAAAIDRATHADAAGGLSHPGNGPGDGVSPPPTARTPAPAENGSAAAPPAGPPPAAGR